MIVDKLKAYALYIVIAAMAVVIAGLGMKLVSKSVQVVELTVALSEANTAKAKAETDLANFRTEQATKTAELEGTNRRLEGQLTANARAAAQEKQNAIEALRTEHAVALQRLLNRPQRPATIIAASPFGPATPAAVPEFCDGSRLWREDGEFLVGENSIARGLQAELRELRVLYQAAVDAQAVSQGVCN